MRFALLSVLLSLCLQAQETVRFRQWMGGKELGGAVETHRREGGALVVERREWLDLDRMGLSIRQELSQQARKDADGRLAFTWSLKLAEMPMEGSGAWDPKAPGRLSVQVKGAAASAKDVPAGAALWPDDFDGRLKEAARLRQPVSLQSFSFPLGQWSSLTLSPVGPEPLPGFADAVHFKGETVEGGTPAPIEMWISPEAGELRERSELGGLELWSQRAELPAPKLDDQGGFFERSLKEIPPDPFALWLPDLVVRFDGGAAPKLPESAEQHALGGSRWRLSRAAAPSKDEAAQPPVSGQSSGEDAPNLAASPLLQFMDPAFDTLLKRMDLKPGLSRWELAKQVTDFVFDWIREKDYSVGFASALEVCRTPKGDCTEHGVLAVALLRKLGVPARGVVGWVALERVMGLHFWVEVKLGSRWVPVDPTFDEAPASAFRIALGRTDLADLGGVGWDAAASAFATGRWVPESAAGRPWGASAALAGDTVQAPDGSSISVKGGLWSLKDGQLTLRLASLAHAVRVVPRPATAQLKDAQRLRSAGGNGGWLDAKARLLWVDLGSRWLSVEEVREPQAYDLLERLKAAR
ncbi:MAG TPA: transglutaminase-like domain-containing protein [Holophagaceae bacterium]|nr:transglutaminase-like domain-containing protein [Holophagaceae bacterium]